MRRDARMLAAPPGRPVGLGEAWEVFRDLVRGGRGGSRRAARRGCQAARPRVPPPRRLQGGRGRAGARGAPAPPSSPPAGAPGPTSATATSAPGSCAAGRWAGTAPLRRPRPARDASPRFPTRSRALRGARWQSPVTRHRPGRRGAASLGSAGTGASGPAGRRAPVPRYAVSAQDRTRALARRLADAGQVARRPVPLAQPPARSGIPWSGGLGEATGPAGAHVVVAHGWLSIPRHAR